MWSSWHFEFVVQVQQSGKNVECACGYIGEESNHSLPSHTILSIFPIFKSISKYVPKSELQNLSKAFPKDVEIEKSIHQILCKPINFCYCLHREIITIE